jgi:hypothetical protein
MVLLWLALSAPSLADRATFPTSDRLDLLKIALTVTGGIGVVVGLTVAYRRQKLGEAEHVRQESSAYRDQTKLLTERFAQAAAQLGNEAPAVRMAGAYAMAALADAWLDQRQMCVDVLCAYLRMPYERDRSKPAWRDGEEQVRFSIIRAISDRLQAGASVSWQGVNLDFSAATFDGGDFSDAILSSGRIRFTRCTFCGDRTDFSGAVFSGAHVDFNEARFEGGAVDFTSAAFTSGAVVFDRANFLGSTVWFDEASFSGALVLLIRAAFTGGKVWFVNSNFADGEVHFSQSTFDGAEVSLRLAQCNGGLVNFGPTRKLGREIFRKTAFADTYFHLGSATIRTPILDLDELRVAYGELGPQGLTPADAEDEANPASNRMKNVDAAE